MAEWSAEEIQTAKELWATGMSADLIGARLGRSRGSILGMADRNRDLLPPRGMPVHFKGGHKGSGKPRAAALSIPRRAMKITDDLDWRETIDESFVPTNPVRFLDLTSRTCRWPLWETGDNPGAHGLCCGEDVTPPQRYCRYHRLVSKRKDVVAGPSRPAARAPQDEGRRA
jgi:hypothetical protein